MMHVRLHVVHTSRRVSIHAPCLLSGLCMSVVGWLHHMCQCSMHTHLSQKAGRYTSCPAFRWMYYQMICCMYCLVAFSRLCSYWLLFFARKP